MEDYSKKKYSPSGNNLRVKFNFGWIQNSIV